jgi:hypothetical protein
MLARLTLDPEDGGRTFVRNVCGLYWAIHVITLPKNSISHCHHSENIKANKYNEVYSILFCYGGSSARVQLIFKSACFSTLKV